MEDSDVVLLNSYSHEAEFTEVYSLFDIFILDCSCCFCFSGRPPPKKKKKREQTLELLFHNYYLVCESLEMKVFC